MFTFWTTSSIFSSPILTGIITVVSPPPFCNPESITPDLSLTKGAGVGLISGVSSGVGFVSGIVGLNLSSGAVSIALNLLNKSNCFSIASAFLFLSLVSSLVAAVSPINASLTATLAFSWFFNAASKLFSAIVKASLAIFNLSDSLANSNSASASSASAKARSKVTSLPLDCASVNNAICVCNSAFLIAASASLTFSCICNSCNSLAAWFLFLVAWATLSLLEDTKSSNLLLSISSFILLTINLFCSSNKGFSFLSNVLATLEYWVSCLSAACLDFSCSFVKNAVCIADKLALSIYLSWTTWLALYSSAHSSKVFLFPAKKKLSKEVSCLNCFKPKVISDICLKNPPNPLTNAGAISKANSLKIGNNSVAIGINSCPISSFNCLSSAFKALDWLAKDCAVLSRSPICTAAFSCINARVANAFSCLLRASALSFPVCSKALVCTSASVIAIP